MTELSRKGRVPVEASFARNPSSSSASDGKDVHCSCNENKRPKPSPSLSTKHTTTMSMNNVLLAQLMKVRVPLAKAFAREWRRPRRRSRRTLRASVVDHVGLFVIFLLLFIKKNGNDLFWIRLLLYFDGYCRRWSPSSQVTFISSSDLVEEKEDDATVQSFFRPLLPCRLHM